MIWGTIFAKNTNFSGSMEGGVEQKTGKIAQCRLADRGPQAVYSGTCIESRLVHC